MEVVVMWNNTLNVEKRGNKVYHDGAALLLYVSETLSGLQRERTEQMHQR
jgi:hypothetical protein